MKQGWTYKKFEDCICKVPKAKQVQTSSYNDGTKYPIISQEDRLISGYCDDESMLFRIERPVVVFGDHTRVLKHIDFNFVVGADGVKILLPIKAIDAKFLFYYLKWYNVPSLGYSRHYKLLKEINIPIPSYEEQLAIVSELDKINELIRLKKEQLSDYDKLAQSIFYEMFGDPVENEKGWKVKKLGEIANFKNGLNFGKNEQGYSYKILGVGDFKDNFVVQSSSLDYINLDKELDNDYFLNSKDIVFVRSNGSKELVGRCVSVDCSEKTTYSGFCIRCRINNEANILPLFLLYICKNKGIREYLTQSGRGCNISNVNQKILNTTNIIMPSLALQQQFAQRMSIIEKQKEQISSTIKDLETLLASRMQYWFE